MKLLLCYVDEIIIVRRWKIIKKILLGLLLSAMMLFPNVAQAHKFTEYGQTYSDVHHMDPNYDVIDYLTYIGVIKGTGNGQFHPQRHVTNRQVALMLVRALRQHNMVFYDNPGYQDVKVYDDGYKEIAIATTLGIFPKEKYFYPNQPITREGMARALTRAFQLSTNTAHNFKDVPSSYWAHQYISTLAAHNITTGYSDGTFRPKQALTRSQFAAFVARALVPDIRPSNKQIGYNQGLMPNPNLTYQSFVRGDTWHYAGMDQWDLTTKKSPTTEQWVTMGRDDTGKVKRLYEETPSSFTSYAYDTMEFPYPLYTGKRWSSGNGTPGVTITYIITTTQGIAVLPHAIYTDVVVVNLEYRTDYGDYMPQTLWFAKGRGLIRAMIGDGYSFYEEAE